MLRLRLTDTEESEGWPTGLFWKDTLQDIDIVAINAGASTDIKGWMYL
jgi:hypothetical protein